MGRIFHLIVLASLLVSSVASADSPTHDRLSDCNWIVSYRGRTYDLAPLTREALARPIETDIRYALQRVPEANDHLLRMGKNLRDARAHTMLASIFVSVFGITQLIKSGEQNETKNREYNIVSYVSAGFFAAAALSSWRATREAKYELVEAVDAFNRNSPHQIEPAAPSGGDGGTRDAKEN